MVATRMDTLKSDCHLYSKYMIGVNTIRVRKYAKFFLFR